MSKSTTRMGNATFVARGYGQVEPNHLSAIRNGQVYAQLPAEGSIELLENGQFVKYDYAKGVCDFSTDETAGPWYMVYNEVKVYEDRETDADFAMIKGKYDAYVYSPIGQGSGVAKIGATSAGYSINQGNFTNAPMPEGSKMTPRVLKISIGDIFTTNTIKAESLSEKDTLKIGEDGYLTAGSGAGGDADPTFVVVKVYTMPDLQPGVKIQRIA